MRGAGALQLDRDFASVPGGGFAAVSDVVPVTSRFVGAVQRLSKELTASRGDRGNRGSKAGKRAGSSRRNASSAGRRSGAAVASSSLVAAGPLEASVVPQRPPQGMGVSSSSSSSSSSSGAANTTATQSEGLEAKAASEDVGSQGSVSTQRQ